MATTATATTTITAKATAATAAAKTTATTRAAAAATTTTTTTRNVHSLWRHAETEADHKDVIHVTIFPHQYRIFGYVSSIYFFCVTSVLPQELPGFTALCFTFRFKVSKRGFLKALWGYSYNKEPCNSKMRKWRPRKWTVAYIVNNPLWIIIIIIIIINLTNPTRETVSCLNQGELERFITRWAIPGDLNTKINLNYT